MDNDFRYLGKLYYTLNEKILLEFSNIKNIYSINNNNQTKEIIIVVESNYKEELKKEAEKKKNLLERIMTIKYNIPILLYLHAGEITDNLNPSTNECYNCIDSTFSVEFDRVKLDFQDKEIQKIIESYENETSDINFLHRSILLNSIGLPIESIKESYKIIEKLRSFAKGQPNEYSKIYCKFGIIRNILSHHDDNFNSYTIQSFKDNFKEKSFDYYEYDIGKKIIKLNLNSDKTINELNKIAKEMIEICKEKLIK
jgi:hypothetical protein